MVRSTLPSSVILLLKVQTNPFFFVSSLFWWSSSLASFSSFSRWCQWWYSLFGDAALLFLYWLSRLQLLNRVMHDYCSSWVKFHRTRKKIPVLLSTPSSTMTYRLDLLSLPAYITARARSKVSFFALFRLIAKKRVVCVDCWMFEWMGWCVGIDTRPHRPFLLFGVKLRG